MPSTSMQRWAFGAIALATLIACSPQQSAVPADQPDPTAGPPVATADAPVPPPEPVMPAPVSQPTEPGYAGAWAPSLEECPNLAETFILTGKLLKLTPQKRTCTVKGVEEEHPSGRSMIYHIKATCLAEPPPIPAADTDDTATLTFGASDTVMQMQVNADPAVTLQRCPPQTP